MNLSWLRGHHIGSRDGEVDDHRLLARPALTHHHRRVDFEFTGAPDAVPADAAAALARVVRWWLGHADRHDARAATARIGLTETELSVAVVDPECSPTCLYGVGEADLAAARPPSDLLDGRMSLLRAGDGALRLEWALDPAARRRHESATYRQDSRPPR
ncbi:hypothetical protein JCM18899A_41150 [Nocardioides sp. AN3]